MAGSLVPMWLRRLLLERATARVRMTASVAMVHRDGNQAVNDVWERIGLGGSNIPGSHLPLTMVNVWTPMSARGGVA
jgi:hypothetical protein